MKFEHPSIVVDRPAPGHYVITGHKTGSIFIEDKGHLVPPASIHITPDVPSDLLWAILEDREATETHTETPAAGGEGATKKTRGRPKNVPKAPAAGGEGESKEAGQ